VVIVSIKSFPHSRNRDIGGRAIKSRRSRIKLNNLNCQLNLHLTVTDISDFVKITKLLGNLNSKGRDVKRGER
jgi:hypothetical protein